MATAKLRGAPLRGLAPRGPAPRGAGLPRDAAQARVAEEGVSQADASDLTPVVAANLKQLRAERGLSLEKLAQRSGVSRAMLNQIENQQSTPTINVLWKIAYALGLPFSALISNPSPPGLMVLAADRARWLRSLDGSFGSRALFPADQARTVEFYELRLAPFAEERADAHAPGTSENLVVARGQLHVEVGGEAHELSTGDAAVFSADVPHVYRNPGAEEAQVFLLMTYAPR